MRILYLCGDHGVPAFGRKGASTHMREMIAALRKAGHAIALAAADLSGDRRSDEDFPAFQLPRPAARWLGTDGRYLAADRLADGVLRDAAMRFEPDVLFERSALYFLAGERLARALGKPRLLEVNTILSEELAGRLHWPGWAARREAHLFRSADGVAAISGEMRKTLLERFDINPARVRTFTMAVDPERFHPRGRSGGIRQRLGIPYDLPVLGFVGSMNHYHRPGWFFDLVDTLLARGHHLAAIAVGGAEAKTEKYRDRTKSGAGAPVVHVQGSVPQEELPDWLDAMDLVVVPGAAAHSTPTKIFEVAAMRIPLLLPDTTPIRELCGKEAVRLMFDERSFEALVALAESWLAEPEPIKAAAAALTSHVLGNCTWEAHARRLGEWYDNLRGGSF
ncbi:glycosyltransferase family 4 protein [Candidatus Poribacteria bacterium]|nr:glycosyltransferase family 4 protein [Candidatus Poribacteria bacterium]